VSARPSLVADRQKTWTTPNCVKSAGAGCSKDAARDSLIKPHTKKNLPMQWFRRISLGRQRGKSGAGHIFPRGDHSSPALSGSCDGPGQKLRLEILSSVRTLALFAPFSIPSPARTGRTQPCQHLPSCLPSGRNSAWQAAAALGLSSDRGVTCLPPTPRGGAGFGNGFSHRACWGFDHLLLLSGVGASASFISQRCCFYCTWRRCVGSCSASAWPAAPGGTGRGPGCLAARLLILRSRAGPGAPPAPSRAGGDGFSRRSDHADGP